MLARIGRRQPSPLRKLQLIDKSNAIKQSVGARTDTLEEPEVLDEQGTRVERCETGASYGFVFTMGNEVVSGYC